jgi:hypothetical protein
MLFRFVGKYTNGHDAINAGVVFVGREPSEVEDSELIRRLSSNPEFEAVAEEKHPLDHDGDGKPGGSLPDAVAPRKRGRPKKVSS